MDIIKAIKRIFAMLLLWCVCIGNCGCNNEAELPVAAVDTVTTGSVKKTLCVDGEVKSAGYTKTITTELVTCPIKEIYVQPGQSVEEGQIICLLDTSKVKLKQGQSPEVVAIRDGVVTEVFAVEGLCSTDGKIASLIDDENLCAEIWLDEVNMPFIKENMKAQITAKELENISTNGKITMLSQINEESGFRAIVELDDSNDFRLGMDVTICFDISKWENVYKINSDCILQIDEASYVLLVNEEENGIYNVEKCNIEVLGIGDDCVAVSCDRLTEGGYIISDVDMYTLGEKVKIQVKNRVD